MADIKISELTQVESASDNDLLVIETSSGSKAIKLSKMLAKIYKALNDCFQSVSNGKSSIAAAITDKGVQTAATDTFTEMSNNIRNIPAGGGLYGIYEQVSIFGGIGFAGIYEVNEE